MVLTVSRQSSFIGGDSQKLGNERYYFVTKYGQRHHRYLPDKVPWPLSYEHDYIELEILEQVYHRTIGSPPSVVPFEVHQKPKRALDIGCGTGSWIQDTLLEWPECTFVGFDLVDIQPSMNLMSNDHAGRVEWVRGNFLSNRLPFEEDEFDYVRIAYVAKGVPEAKWGNLLEEVYRVLQFGGTVELLEEDILFPTLPRWYTSILRPEHAEDNELLVHLDSVTSEVSSMFSKNNSHDHALLESLFYGVFESRFINTRPTSVIPAYFTMYFTNVTTSVATVFTMPPFRQPVRRPSAPLPNFAGFRLEAPPMDPTITSRSSASTETTSNQSWRSARDSAIDLNGGASTNPVDATGYRELLSPNVIAAATAQLTSAVVPPSTSLDHTPRFNDFSRRTTHEFHLGDEELHAPTPVDGGPSGMTMHLHRAVATVLACREAMWDELRDRLRTRPNELASFGWEVKARFDLDEEEVRERFEHLIDRYHSDMRIRLSLEAALTDFGWALPHQSPLTYAESLERERLFAAWMNPSFHIPNDGVDNSPCRKTRSFYGFKGS